MPNCAMTFMYNIECSLYVSRMLMSLRSDNLLSFGIHPPLADGSQHVVHSQTISMC